MVENAPVLEPEITPKWVPTWVPVMVENAPVLEPEITPKWVPTWVPLWVPVMVENAPVLEPEITPKWVPTWVPLWVPVMVENAPVLEPEITPKWVPTWVPENVPAVNALVLETYLRPVSVFIARDPDCSSTNAINLDEATLFSATVVTVSAFPAVFALPVVFWLPAVLTPGRLIFAPPLNETPPMVLAVVSVSAETARPSFDMRVTVPAAFVIFPATLTSPLNAWIFVCDIVISTRYYFS
jgi:hypothetical protein